MKKRRELDALVGAVKSRRKSSKSGHELLRYNGSESSDCDDYSVVTKKTRGSGLCTTCTSIFTFLLLVACMLVCAGLTWMHVEMKKDLETLRQGLQAVEGKSVVNIEDIQKLFSQMSAFNKSQEATSRQLTQVSANISSINTTISKLSEDVAKLGEGLRAAPELKELPDKLQTVSKSLASLGSDVTGMKDLVSSLQSALKEKDAKLQGLDSQIQALKQVTEGTTAADNELPPDITNLIQTLSQRLEDVNSTASGQLSVMMKSLSLHEERLVSLENSTELLRKDVTALSTDHTTISSDHASMADMLSSEQFRTGVTDIVHNLLSHTNQTSSLSTDEKTPPPSTQSSGQSSSSLTSVSAVMVAVKDSLDRIQVKYEHLNSSVQKNADDIKEIKQDYVPIMRLNQFGEGFQTYMENLNATIAILTAKLENKTAIVMPSPTSPPLASTTVNDKLSEGTAIEGHLGKDTESEDQLDTNTDGKKQLITDTEGEEGSEGKADETQGEKTASPSTKAPTTGQTTVTKSPASPDAGSKAPNISAASVVIPNIKTATDLDLAFRRWDRTGDGQVRYETLPDFLDPDTPPKAQLKPFDEDNNDLYTLEEFAKALGITLDTEPTSGRET